MKRHEKEPTDPDIRGSEKALHRAARRALELGKQTGTPVYVIENGKIVDLNKGRRKPLKH